MLKNQKYL